MLSGEIFSEENIIAPSIRPAQAISTGSKGFFYLHTMDSIRLEYSEHQQMFHFNTGDRPPETNGYVTIESHIEREKALELIKGIRNTFQGVVITLDMVNYYFNGNLSEDE